MAREKKAARGPDESPPQEEMTVVVLKFKGGSESLQKGFDAVSQAIAALGPAPPNNHRAAIQRTPAHIAAPQNGSVIDADTEDVVEGAEEPEETAAVAETATNGKPKKAWEPKKYTFLSEFDLAPAGQPSLKEYCTQKDPQTDNDKYLVASAWIMKHGGVDGFTDNHIFTCFRGMEWKTQVDLTQPMRLMKSKKSYFENPTRGTWRLTAGIGMPAAEAVGK
jgi:hypothetical protein